MTEDLPPIDPAPRTGASRSVKVVLFVSLALNLLIAGAIGGAVFSHWRPGADPSLRDAGLGPLAFVLNREQRSALRAQLRHQGPELSRNRAEMRRDIDRLLSALRAEPFRPEALAAVLKDQAQTVEARQQIGYRALYDAVVAATPAERRDMADRIQRALRRVADRPRDRH